MKPSKYYSPEQLPKFAEALEAKQPIADIDWGFGDATVGGVADTLYPEMLAYGETMAKTRAKGKKEAYAKTAARLMALSVVEFADKVLVCNTSKGKEAVPGIEGMAYLGGFMKDIETKPKKFKEFMQYGMASAGFYRYQEGLLMGLHSYLRLLHDTDDEETCRRYTLLMAKCLAIVAEGAAMGAAHNTVGAYEEAQEKTRKLLGDLCKPPRKP